MKRPTLSAPLLSLFMALLGGLVVQAQTRPANPPHDVRQGRDATVSELVHLMSANLANCKKKAYRESPQTSYGSWKVTYQPQHSLIEVQREQEVLIPYVPTFNDTEEKHPPTPGIPEFSFRVRSFLSPAKYAHLKAENESIERQLHQMEAAMKGITHKFDSYLPKSKEEKKKAITYDKLKKSRHDLPAFYFRNISLSWSEFEGDSTFLGDPGEDPPFVTETTEKAGWHREQADAARAVLQLLSRYEPQTR